MNTIYQRTVFTQLTLLIFKFVIFNLMQADAQYSYGVTCGNCGHPTGSDDSAETPQYAMRQLQQVIA